MRVDVVRARRRCSVTGRAMLAAVIAIVPLALLGAGSAAAGVAGPPTRVLAIASPGSARVGWFGPDVDGGSPITSYRVTASTGAVFTVAGSPATITGLANGVTVSFRVAAVNADGVGPMSAPSATVTPSTAQSPSPWSARAPMIAARSSAPAVRLRSGKVLVVAGDPGGFDATPRTSAELFDPATNSWSTTGSLPEPRSSFTTTVLGDGRVLVAGGLSASFRWLATTRVYDPGIGTWSAAAPMARARAAGTATLLDDGRVLVAGGSTTGPRALAAAEIYDPASDTWTAARPMKVARFAHSATALPDGRVVVAGGTAGGQGFRSTEVYTPSTGRWSTAGDLVSVRENDEVCCKQAVLLSSGRVLVAGGWDLDVLATAEVFDPVTATWSATGRMRVGREAGFSLVRLPDNRILAVGGLDSFGGLKYAETYDESTGRWTRVNDLRVPRYGPSVVALASGSVLVAGGGDQGRSVRSAELFAPAP